MSNNDWVTSAGDFHSSLADRLTGFETNAIAFVATVGSALGGLAYVHWHDPTPLKVIFATLGALVVLGIGAFYLQATAHSHKSILIVMWKIEKKLGLANKVVPKAWDQKNHVKNADLFYEKWKWNQIFPFNRESLRWCYYYFSEILKVQLISYAVLAICAWGASWIWIALKSPEYLVDAWGLLRWYRLGLLVLPLIVLIGMYLFFQLNNRRLVLKQVGLFDHRKGKI
ncbi:MAG: hypothetical protein LHV69_07700 [Elusimicrobia bacterium]|nr:hypothetical protein [Candidatus Obscuribacterium magneticum]